MSEQSRAPESDGAGGARADDGGQADVGPRTEDTARAEGPLEAEPGSGVGTDADGPRVVGLESADAGEVIGAVGSDTARTVLETLHEEPASASAVADRVDCSLQTVQYHLGNLTEAGLVEQVDTATSEKGREMDVYGPARQPVVVYAGDDDGVDLRGMLSRLVPAVALLGLASLVVQELFGAAAGPETGDAVAVSAKYASEAAAPTGPEPGLVFFAGGLVVLLAYVGWWQLRRRGHLEQLPLAS